MRYLKVFGMEQLARKYAADISGGLFGNLTVVENNGYWYVVKVEELECAE